MDSLFGLGGGSRRRATATPNPVVDPNVYRWYPANTTPLPGRISADNTIPASVTHLYVSVLGEDGQDNSNWLSELCANMYDVSIEVTDDPNSYAQYRVTAVTSGTDSYDLTVTYLAGAGELPGDGAVFFEILPVPNAILTAKGDLLSRSSTTPVKRAVGIDGQILVADDSQASGLNWLTFQSAWFGTGKDGSSTLGSDTALAANLSYHRNYTTLDLSTFTLNGTAGAGADKESVYCISVLLTGNGGSIRRNLHATNVGGAARVQGGTSGAGGDGVGARVGLFVYAYKVSGTVTINGGGADGTAGGNASGTPTGTQTGAGGTSTTSSVYFHAADITSSSSAAAGGGGAAGGTAGGAGGTPVVAEQLYTLNDPLRFLITPRLVPIDTVSDGTRFCRITRVPYAPSGGSGGIASASAASGGGGGGGSFGLGAVGGVAGGAGGAGGGTIGAGGGGGAAGGSGSFCAVMVGQFAAGTNFTAHANGGNGGNGGNGAGTNGGGGGGGAGGTGGFVYAVLPVNYSSVTVSVTASGGTKGTKGVKAGLGTDGSDGNNGNAGVASIMTLLG